MSAGISVSRGPLRRTLGLLRPHLPELLAQGAQPAQGPAGHEHHLDAGLVRFLQRRDRARAQVPRAGVPVADDRAVQVGGDHPRAARRQGRWMIRSSAGSRSW